MLQEEGVCRVFWQIVGCYSTMSNNVEMLPFCPLASLGYIHTATQYSCHVWSAKYGSLHTDQTLTVWIVFDYLSFVRVLQNDIIHSLISSINCFILNPSSPTEIYCQIYAILFLLLYIIHPNLLSLTVIVHGFQLLFKTPLLCFMPVWFSPS